MGCIQMIPDANLSWDYYISFNTNWNLSKIKNHFSEIHKFG